jgi:hypothetical protein
MIIVSGMNAARRGAVRDTPGMELKSSPQPIDLAARLYPVPRTPSPGCYLCVKSSSRTNTARQDSVRS